MRYATIQELKTPLQVGDTVIHGFGHAGKITEIMHGIYRIKDKGFDQGDGQDEVTFAANEIGIIPLTEDLLLRNGFWYGDSDKSLRVIEWRGSAADSPHINMIREGDCNGFPSWTVQVRGAKMSSYDEKCNVQFFHELQRIISDNRIVKNLKV